MLPSPRRRRRRRGWATATRPRHVVRSSAEVVTHQVCAQGARSGVSAGGRATAGVGSETAGGGLANATARPPRCSAASIALTRQHRTPSCPAGAGGAAMSPEKSKWRAPRKCRRWASSCCRLHAARSASLLLRFGGTSTYLGCVWEPLFAPLLSGAKKSGWLQCRPGQLGAARPGAGPSPGSPPTARTGWPPPGPRASLGESRIFHPGPWCL